MNFANIFVILLAKLIQLASGKPQYGNYPGYPVQTVTYNPLSPTFSDLNVAIANNPYGSSYGQIQVWPYVVANSGYPNNYVRPTLQTTNTYNPNVVYNPNTGTYVTNTGAYPSNTGTYYNPSNTGTYPSNTGTYQSNTGQYYNPNLLTSWYGYGTTT